MKARTYLLPLALGAILLPAGCRKYTGEKAAEERLNWLEALDDSIARISAQRLADSVAISELQTRLNDEIQFFSTIDNAREVEPYYILTRFKGSYPLSSTGIAARMMKSEQLELIAALSGKRFNAIEVTDGSRSARSQTVPADQALNYTSGGLTTVAFTGAEADSIAALTAEAAASDPLTLRYLQDGAVVASHPLSEAQRQWISQTWSVCSGRAELRRRENAMLVASRKIEILKITLSEQAGESKQSSESK